MVETSEAHEREGTPQAPAPNKGRLAGRLPDRLVAGLRRFRREVRLKVRRRRQRRAAKQRKRSLPNIALGATLLVLLGAFGAALLYLAPQQEGARVSLTDFATLSSQKQILSAVFLDEDAMVVGRFRCTTLKAGITIPAARSCPDSKDVHPDDADATIRFLLPYPKSGLATSALIQAATKAGARVSVDPQIRKGQVRTVATFLLPLMILANLFVLLFSTGRRNGGAIGDVMIFGSIRKGVLRRSQQTERITFEDVAGADEAVTEMREVVDYLKDPAEAETGQSEEPAMSSRSDAPRLALGAAFVLFKAGTAVARQRSRAVAAEARTR